MKYPLKPFCMILSFLVLSATGCCKQDARQPSPAPGEKPAPQAQEPQRPDGDQQAEKPETAAEPESPEQAAAKTDESQSAGPATSQPKPEEPREPKRPKPTWVIFREAIDPEEDAEIKAAWRGEYKFSIDTSNVKRVTIDMTKLPEGPPQKGPWIIQIDNQGIELTGFKPRPGYTGHIRDLIRSKNGVWDVDRKRLYRQGG